MIPPDGEMQPGELTVVHRNDAGCRPYIDYSKGWGGRWHFNHEYQAAMNPPVIFLTREEKDWALEAIEAASVPIPFVTIEPNIRPKPRPNKQWKISRYWEVADRLQRHHNIAVVQMGPNDGMQNLAGVIRIITPSFRLACAILHYSFAHIGPEGGLAHATVAVDTPGAIIFGGNVHPDLMGYPMNRNLFIQHEESPCGWHNECDHCRQCLDAITVGDVVEATLGLVRPDK